MGRTAVVPVSEPTFGESLWMHTSQQDTAYTQAQASAVDSTHVTDMQHAGAPVDASLIDDQFAGNASPARPAYHPAHQQYNQHRRYPPHSTNDSEPLHQDVEPVRRPSLESSHGIAYQPWGSRMSESSRGLRKSDPLGLYSKDNTCMTIGHQSGSTAAPMNMSTPNMSSPTRSRPSIIKTPGNPTPSQQQRHSPMFPARHVAHLLSKSSTTGSDQVHAASAPLHDVCIPLSSSPPSAPVPWCTAPLALAQARSSTSKNGQGTWASRTMHITADTVQVPAPTMRSHSPLSHSDSVDGHPYGGSMQLQTSKNSLFESVDKEHTLVSLGLPSPSLSKNPLRAARKSAQFRKLSPPQSPQPHAISGCNSAVSTRPLDLEEGLRGLNLLILPSGPPDSIKSSSTHGLRLSANPLKAARQCRTARSQPHSPLMGRRVAASMSAPGEGPRLIPVNSVQKWAVTSAKELRLWEPHSQQIAMLTTQGMTAAVKLKSHHSWAPAGHSLSSGPCFGSLSHHCSDVRQSSSSTAMPYLVAMHDSVLSLETSKLFNGNICSISGTVSYRSSQAPQASKPSAAPLHFTSMSPARADFGMMSPEQLSASMQRLSPLREHRTEDLPVLSLAPTQEGGAQARARSSGQQGWACPRDWLSATDLKMAASPPSSQPSSRSNSRRPSSGSLPDAKDAAALGPSQFARRSAATGSPAPFRPARLSVGLNSNTSLAPTLCPSPFSTCQSPTSSARWSPQAGGTEGTQSTGGTAERTSVHLNPYSDEGGRADSLSPTIFETIQLTQPRGSKAADSALFPPPKMDPGWDASPADMSDNRNRMGQSQDSAGSTEHCRGSWLTQSIPLPEAMGPVSQRHEDPWLWEQPMDDSSVSQGAEFAKRSVHSRIGHSNFDTYSGDGTGSVGRVSRPSHLRVMQAKEMDHEGGAVEVIELWDGVSPPRHLCPIKTRLTELPPPCPPLPVGKQPSVLFDKQILSKACSEPLHKSPSWLHPNSEHGSKAGAVAANSGAMMPSTMQPQKAGSSNEPIATVGSMDMLPYVQLQAHEESKLSPHLRIEEHQGSRLSARHSAIEMHHLQQMVGPKSSQHSECFEHVVDSNSGTAGKMGNADSYIPSRHWSSQPLPPVVEASNECSREFSALRMSKRNVVDKIFQAIKRAVKLGGAKRRSKSKRATM